MIDNCNVCVHIVQFCSVKCFCSLILVALTQWSDSLAAVR